jgi:hypothetical protein
MEEERQSSLVVATLVGFGALVGLGSCLGLLLFVAG